MHEGIKPTEKYDRHQPAYQKHGYHPSPTSGHNDAVALATTGQQAAITAAVALATQTETMASQNVYLPSPPEVEFDKVTKQFLDKKLPSCTNPPNIDDTALIDSTASITLLNKRAKSNRAKL